MGKFQILASPYYRTRPGSWTFRHLHAVDSRSFVSRHWRYVFLRIPKAANTTVMASLVGAFPEPDFPGFTVSDFKRRMTRLSDLKRAEVTELDSYFIFSFVRNPYHRVLSAFLDKMNDSRRFSGRYGARVAALDGGKVTFRGFCRYLARGGEAENAHWMAQTRMLHYAPHVDFVGRVETLERDLGTTFARIGGEASVRTMVPRQGHATGASSLVEQSYDDESKDLIARVYADDFARFGYATETLSPIGPGSSAASGSGSGA